MSVSFNYILFTNILISSCLENYSINVTKGFFKHTNSMYFWKACYLNLLYMIHTFLLNVYMYVFFLVLSLEFCAGVINEIKKRVHCIWTIYLLFINECKTYRAYLYNDQTDYVHTMKSLYTFKVQNVKKKTFIFHWGSNQTKK